MDSALFRAQVGRSLTPRSQLHPVNLTPEAKRSLQLVRQVSAVGRFAKATDDEIASAVMVAYAEFLANTTLYDLPGRDA